MSQQRPKSPAAGRLAQRVRTPELTPWNSSVRTRDSGPRGSAPATSARARGARERSSSARKWSSPSPYYALTANPAAVLAAAPSTSVGEPQVELMSQLQDVVVRLSQSAVGEKQRLSHLNQRVDAYAALVREQDRLIDELRGMNLKMQKEMDTLMSFRQQSLNHDLRVMNALEGGAGVDEEIYRAFMWHEERAASYGKSCNNSSSAPLNSMSPRTRVFVRSLVAQLRDERRKRLEVEEQSSRMIGEQQITIQRLEDRLKSQYSRSNGPLFGRHEELSSPAHKDTDGKQGAATKDANEASTKDAPDITPVGNLHQFPVAPTGSGGVWSEDETKQDVREAKAVMSVRSVATCSGVSLAHATPGDTSVCSVTGTESKDIPSTNAVDLYSLSAAVEPPLTIHGNTYEDAAAILYDIKKRHGF